MQHIKKMALGASMAAVLSTTIGLASPVSAMQARDATETFGRLTALNNSGVEGSAEAIVFGRKVTVDIDARKTVRGMPHAQHIHFGAKARHECPTAPAAGKDGRLSTTDGAAAYGPIRISLTTKGDTSPKSGLAVTRFPAPARGTITYNRVVRTGKNVARAISRGEAVYVLHGVDYNGNGKYDFSRGKSELDPSLPAEATDPAACTVLHVTR